MIHIKGGGTTVIHNVLDNYSDESKRLMIDIMKENYSFEWQRTRDIEQKATNTIGFVGFVLSLTFVALTTIVVDLDEEMRCKILFSSLISPTLIIIIFFLMLLSIGLGIYAISIKEWKQVSSYSLLVNCKNTPTTNTKLLETIFNDHEEVIHENKKNNDKMACATKYSLRCFGLSLFFLICFFMYLLAMYTC